MKFGYSTRVYFGDGKDLITRDDQVLKLLLSKIARQERSRAILSRPIAKS